MMSALMMVMKLLLLYLGFFFLQSFNNAAMLGLYPCLASCEVLGFHPSRMPDPGMRQKPLSEVDWLGVGDANDDRFRKIFVWLVNLPVARLKNILTVNLMRMQEVMNDDDITSVIDKDYQVGCVSLAHLMCQVHKVHEFHPEKLQDFRDNRMSAGRFTEVMQELEVEDDFDIQEEDGEGHHMKMIAKILLHKWQRDVANAFPSNLSVVTAFSNAQRRRSFQMTQNVIASAAAATKKNKAEAKQKAEAKNKAEGE